MGSKWTQNSNTLSISPVSSPSWAQLTLLGNTGLNVKPLGPKYRFDSGGDNSAPSPRLLFYAGITDSEQRRRDNRRALPTTEKLISDPTLTSLMTHPEACFHIPQCLCYFRILFMDEFLVHRTVPGTVYICWINCTVFIKLRNSF